MAGKARREFRLKDSTSDKFWAISLRGPSHTVHYGRVGSAGQKRITELDDAAAALASYEKLIAQKTKKGYVEVAKPAKKKTPKKKTAKKKPAKKKPAKDLDDRARALLEHVLHSEPESDLTTLSRPEIDKESKKRGAIPEELIAVWSTIGCGTIGDSRYQIYEGFYEPQWIWDEERIVGDLAHLQGIVLVGDDFAGGHDGYDPASNWAFVSVSGGGRVTPHPEDDFLAHLERWFDR